MASRLNFISSPKFIFSTIFCLFLYYIFLANSWIDPDFGWHLKFGEIILKTHFVPKLDLFSYTMPSYNFVNNAWFSDVIIAYFYKLFGSFFLVVIFSFLTLFSLVLHLKPYIKNWGFASFILAAASALPFLTIRPQVFSLFFTSILLYILIYEKQKKWIKFLPLLFFLWVNLHGGFVLGIVIFAIYIFAKTIEEKKLSLISLIIFALSFLATFINPYGISLWKEIFSITFDPNIKSSIQEWSSSFYFANIPYVFLLVFSSVLVFKYHKMFSIFEKLIYILFFLLSITISRNMFFFAPVGLVIMSKGFAFLYQDLKKYPFGRKRFATIYPLICLGCFLIFLLNVVPNTAGFFNSSSKTSAYPNNAISFLKKNPSSGEVFSIYDWGGYLIWKYPEKKVFVDGRMPNWKMDNPPKGQSGNAFLEWGEIINGKISVKDAIKKYNIDTFLLPLQNDIKNNTYLKINNELSNLLGIKTYDVGILQKELNNIGEIVIYKDSTAIIYRKIDSK